MKTIWLNWQRPLSDAERADWRQAWRRTMTQPITALRDAYAGQTCYIVGKGPSLVNLTVEHFPTSGPLLAINQAIRKVQAVGAANPILSMQKDGAYPVECAAPCANCPDVGPDMVLPEPGALLLVSKANSEHCFADYRPRYVFDTERDFGICWRMPSIVVAIKIAELFGCSSLAFVSCDIHTTGDRRSCADGLATVEEMPNGGQALTDMPKLVDGLLAVSRIRDVRWVTP